MPASEHVVCDNCKARTWRLMRWLSAGLCLRCAARWRHFSRSARVLADPSQWSESSKRSRSYEPSATIYYYDEFYWCRACGRPSVFSAQDQKHAFEVEKRYIHSTRVLCDPCYLARKAVRQRA